MKCYRHGVNDPYECSICLDLELSLDERWAQQQELQEEFEELEEVQLAQKSLKEAG